MTSRRHLVYGWGVNDSDYPLRICQYSGRDSDGKQKVKVLWSCLIFSRWVQVLQRCYSPAFIKKNPSYDGCSVSQEWKYFSDFKGWMEKQDWEGKHLDKDILVKGNKVYGPDTCVFVERKVNNFFKNSYQRDSETSQGVYLRKDTDKFRVMCRQLDGSYKYLGQYDNETDASEAWFTEKSRMAKILAEKQENPRLKEAMTNYYN